MARYHGKHTHVKKFPITLLAVLLILFCSAGGTLAWLATSTGPVTNTFEKAAVQCVVSDTYRNHAKSDIVVSVPKGTDNENIAAYIRVRLVPTWEDAQGNAVMKEVPNFLIPEPTREWFLGSDGNYYYSKPVQPGSATTKLFNQFIDVPESEDGYEVNLQVLAEAVQAEGTDAVVQIGWPVKINSSGNLVSK